MPAESAGCECRSLDATDESAQPTKNARFDAVADARAVDVAANKPRIFEHLEVLRHGGLSQVEAIHDVAADAAISSSEESHDLDAGRMRDGFR